MKTIKITNIEGKWNEKAYNSKIEGTKKIYINNKEIIIAEEELNKIITANELSAQQINYYLFKLELEEQATLLSFISANLKKEYNKEQTNYENNFEENSIQIKLIEEFKKLSFDEKVKVFNCMKNDYYDRLSLKESGKMSFKNC